MLNFSKFYFLSLLYSFVLTISAIVFNNRLIPLYGIEGAALASLFSYLLYFVLMLLTLAVCIHTHPFCWGHMKTLFIMLLLFYACIFVDILEPAINIWLRSAIKTVLWLLGLYLAYRWRISPELNETIRNILKK